MNLCSLISDLSRPCAPISCTLPPVLPPLLDVRAVFVDVYGTLLVSAAGEPGLTAGGAIAAEMALHACGVSHKAESGEQIVKLLHAKIAHAHRLQHAAGCLTPEVDVVGIWREVLAEIAPAMTSCGLSAWPCEEIALRFELAVNPVWPMPSASDSLRAIAARGIALGLISNAQFYTPLILQELMPDLYPDGFLPELCFWSYRNKMAKPGVAMYQQAVEALERLHIRPEQALMIGNDMRNDLRPAQLLGFRGVLFAGDQRSLRLRLEDPPQALPAAVLTQWSQLLDILAVR